MLYHLAKNGTDRGPLWCGVALYGFAYAWMVTQACPKLLKMGFHFGWSAGSPSKHSPGILFCWTKGGGDVVFPIHVGLPGFDLTSASAR